MGVRWRIRVRVRVRARARVSLVSTLSSPEERTLSLMFCSASGLSTC